MRVVVPPYDQPAAAGKCWIDGGVEVVNVPLPRGGAQIGALALVSSLVRATTDWRPDVVHSFKPKGYSGLAAVWLARRGFMVVQDSDDWEQGWNDRVGYARGWGRLFAWQEGHGLHDAAAVTVASRWLERFAIRLRGSSQGVFYLPNGVEAGRLGAVSHSGNTMFSNTNQSGSMKRVLVYTRFGEASPAMVWRIWSAVLVSHPASGGWLWSATGPRARGRHLPG